jgi:hypothetical protein
MPQESNRPLRPADIKAVAEYVASTIKGKGDPTFAQCQAFFGTGTRVCDVYAKDGERGNKDTASSGPAEASPHQHLKVEAAGDANAPSK